MAYTLMLSSFVDMNDQVQSQTLDLEWFDAISELIL